MKFSDLKRISEITCQVCFDRKSLIVEYGPPAVPLIRSYLGQCQDCGIIYNYRLNSCECGGSIKTDEDIFCLECHNTHFEVTIIK